MDTQEFRDDNWNVVVRNTDSTQHYFSLAVKMQYKYKIKDLNWWVDEDRVRSVVMDSFFKSTCPKRL